MLISLLILAVSAVLLAYWFRYTCIMIIDSRQFVQHAEKIALANRLSFAGIQQDLLNENVSLDILFKSLDNDYRVISYLQQHAAALSAGSVEQKLLSIDYTVVKLWYGVTKLVAPPQARKALMEMSAIIGYLAGEMGERTIQNSVA